MHGGDRQERHDRRANRGKQHGPAQVVLGDVLRKPAGADDPGHGRDRDQVAGRVTPPEVAKDRFEPARAASSAASLAR